MGKHCKLKKKKLKKYKAKIRQITKEHQEQFLEQKVKKDFLRKTASTSGTEVANAI